MVVSSDWRSVDFEKQARLPGKDFSLGSHLIATRNKWMTSMAVSDSLVALSSTSQNKNMHLIPVDVKTGNLITEKASSYSSPLPIFSLDQRQDKILAGCSRNQLQMFQLDTDAGGLLNVRLISTYSLPLKSEFLEFPAPPGKYDYSVRIRHVQFPGSRSGNDVSSFMAIENCNLRLWNAEILEAPVLNAKISHEKLSCADWNPAQPLVCTGSADGSIDIVDLRCMGYSNQKDRKPHGNPVIWNRAFCHSKSAITDVKWNPLVSFWFASSGDDGLVKVWDMRSDKAPVYTLGALGEHYSAPACISWSQVHSSYINVGCVDGQCIVWNLETPSTAHVVSRYGESDFTADVVVTASLPNVDKYLSLSSSGELVIFNFESNYLEQAASHKLAKSNNPAKYYIESMIFKNDVDAIVHAMVDNLDHSETIDLIREVEFEMPSIENDYELTKSQSAGFKIAVNSSMFTNTNDPFAIAVQSTQSRETATVAEMTAGIEVILDKLHFATGASKLIIDNLLKHLDAVYDGDEEDRKKYLDQIRVNLGPLRVPLPHPVSSRK